MDAESITILPPLRIPLGWANDEIIIKIPAQWRRRLEAKAAHLTDEAAELGLEIIEEITPETIVQRVIFFYLETDGGWGEFIGDPPKKPKRTKKKAKKSPPPAQPSNGRQVTAEAILQFAPDSEPP
jgi:hypothetical protein